jgi:hypothetical protein
MADLLSRPVGIGLAKLEALEMGMRTISPRFVPASRVKAGSFRLGRMAVRTSDDCELGKLLGFVIDAATHRLCSLVIERDERHVEVPMTPIQFDPSGRALRLLNDETPEGRPFNLHSLPHVTVEDLWVPMLHSAA